MNNTFLFTGSEELREKIITAVREAEKRAKARRLPMEKLEELVEAVASAPYGYAEGDGGHVTKSYHYRAETTYFSLAWYTRRREKLVSLYVHRGKADHVAYGSSGYISVHPNQGKWRALSTVLPEHAEKISKRLRAIKLRAILRHLPPPPPGFEPYNAFPDEGGLVKVPDGFSYFYIVTPAGWIRVPWKKGDEKRSAWTILARLGFPVPRRKTKRVWNENMAAYAAMYILGGEKE